MSNTKIKSRRKIISNTGDKPGSVFKAWCFKNGIMQTQMADDTGMSVSGVHIIWNDGRVSKSILTLLSYVYDIDKQYLKKMIETQNTDPKLTARMLNNIKQRVK